MHPCSPSPVRVDVVIRPRATSVNNELARVIAAFLHGLGRPISPGEAFIPDAPPVLVTCVERLRVCDLLPGPLHVDRSTQFHCFFHVLHASEVTDEPLDLDGENADGGGQLPACEITSMPNRMTDGLWESLQYADDIKLRLLRYAETCAVLSRRGVDSNLVSWNRMVLLHGPPGTGKTSLCKALSHKLAVRMNASFRTTDLIEVNAHSLFSRWFSESGKQVMTLFRRIREMAEDPQTLVCVLIDEVESLAAARRSASSGNEPSDAIRVVNALLTQLDALRRLPNVLVLATSNITGVIDLAFIDRADLKLLVSPPPLAVKVSILASAVNHLVACGVVEPPVASDDEAEPSAVADTLTPLVAEVEAILHDNMTVVSGRTLRKWPMLALSHALNTIANDSSLPFSDFLTALRTAAMADAVSRTNLDPS